MSKKCVRFVFKEKAKIREKFPCCVLAHQISVGATKLVWDDKINISHPYAELAMTIQKIRSDERSKNTGITDTPYSTDFELKCRAFLKDNYSKILSFEKLEGVPEVLEIMESLGMKAVEKPEPKVSTFAPETV